VLWHLNKKIGHKSIRKFNAASFTSVFKRNSKRKKNKLLSPIERVRYGCPKTSLFPADSLDTRQSHFFAKALLARDCRMEKDARQKAELDGPERTNRGERGTSQFHAPFDRRRPVSRRLRKKSREMQEWGIKRWSIARRSFIVRSGGGVDDGRTVGALFTFLSSGIGDYCPAHNAVERRTRAREDTMPEEHGGTDEPPWERRCQRPRRSILESEAAGAAQTLFQFIETIFFVENKKAIK